jgi:hypothetical protein
MSFDIDVIAQDPMQSEQMADYTVMSIWIEKRSALSFEGLEVIGISMGGEAEDTYDETAEIFYYTNSLSLQIQSDWEVHVPMPFTVSRVVPVTAVAEASMTPDRMGPGQSSIQPYAGGGLLLATVPVLVGRNSSYERIK